MATACAVTGEAFIEDERVMSHLVRSAENGEVQRYDVKETVANEFTPEGRVACRWVHPFKPKVAGENPERELKLTAENLFMTMADPGNELGAEDGRLVQFLALMLERKRVIRPKGRNEDGTKDVYEMRGTKARYEVPIGDLDPAFFIAVQEQLSVLVGGPDDEGSTDEAPKAAGAPES
ncbi:hypothetical protein [Actomonas aquatica]|uniref:Uncharacterized protein n=1 Tax=Actomonas aquatica TaxID=2866162 RepID=A0ABZ1C8M2_9BACT|nr:hypothetical protein [Opitutus sp. WL0086]WRQ88049.1 hypothetical protein K1X11_001430 [Opitutus sp. WL0086]